MDKAWKLFEAFSQNRWDFNGILLKNCPYPFVDKIVYIISFFVDKPWEGYKFAIATLLKPVCNTANIS
jgi:hypothetical protein